MVGGFDKFDPMSFNIKVVLFLSHPFYNINQG